MDTNDRDVPESAIDQLVNGAPNKGQEETTISPLDASFTVSNNVLVVAIKLPDTSPCQGKLPAMTLDFRSMRKVKAPNIDITALLEPEGTKESADDEIAARTIYENEELVRDGEYYLDMVKFEFDEVQFLVPRWGFQQASPDSTLILPREEEDLAYTQDDVSALDFRHMMEFLYPLDPMEGNLSREAWISTSKLSSGWCMIQYRKRALAEIEVWQAGSSSMPPLQPEEKVVLGRTCGISAWYKEGCISFADGSAKLESTYETSIGIDAMIKIARAQDAAYQPDYDLYHQHFSSPSSLVHAIPTEIPEEDTPSPSLVIVEEICEARRHRLVGRLRMCYQQLIYRQESITLEEVVLLGLDTTLGLWKARLILRQQFRDALVGRHALANTNFASAIEAEFSQEIADIESLRLILDLPPLDLPPLDLPPLDPPPPSFYLVTEPLAPVVAAAEDDDDRGPVRVASWKKKRLRMKKGGR